MRGSVVSLLGTTVLALMMLVAAQSSTIQAQPYPPPVGSLSVAASSTTPPAGSTTTVSATVLDNSGNPVADAEVVFQIESQPASGALFSNGLSEITVLTDENGIAIAILSVGGTPGEIIVTMLAGDKTSQVALQVQGAPGGAPPTGGPPAADTGGDGLDTWQLALMALGLTVVLAGGVILRRRKAS